MDESEDNMNVDKIKIENGQMDKDKPKKRSLVERELETTLTAHVTAPLPNGEGASKSRYGRARRLKTNTDFCDTEKSVTNYLKSSPSEKVLINCQPTSPVYKMQASNSLIHESSPKRVVEMAVNLESQIDHIYNANISLSRFGSDEKNSNSQSPAKKFPKVYLRRDLIQPTDSPVVSVKNISPIRSASKPNSHLRNILERSSEKYDLNVRSQNGYLDNSSVVKTLDFDCSKKKKKENKETKASISKSDLFDLEAKCEYQVGDIAWARMGTFPFWPCIVTREPGTEMFVRKKIFGKIERDIIHVTFFGDNGRRSWIIDSMLRKFQGLAEFEAARDQFTPEAKKRDPKLHAAFFISDKKLVLWYTAIEEADILQREPKRLRIDLLNEMLGHGTVKHTPLKIQKSGKVTRTNSDVSLSESLYDSLFSENDGKLLEVGHKKSKSLDVSEVVTACLDNMAAKTGMTMIQRQSHMDIWLQKAKSKTPEKLNVTVTVERLENERKTKSKESDTKSKSKEGDNNTSKKKKKSLSRENPIKKPYSFRQSTESQNLFSYHNEHDYSKNIEIFNKTHNTADTSLQPDIIKDAVVQCDNDICVIDKVESLCMSQAQHDNTTLEIHEEIVTDVDLSQVERDTEDTNASEEGINQPIAMDVDDYEIEQSKGNDQIHDKIDQSNDPLVGEQKQTDTFITKTGKQSTRTNNFKHANKKNRSTPGKMDDLKDKDDHIRHTESSNNMSIDDVTDYKSDQGLLQNISTASDQENKNKSCVIDEIGQQELVKPEGSKTTETQYNQVPMNMSVDDDFANSERIQGSLGTETSLLKKNKHDIDVGKVNRSANEFLAKTDGEVKLLSLQNKNISDNQNEIPTKSMDKDDTIEVSLTNTEINTNELSPPDFQTERINNSEKIPIIKLTVIKEAILNSFKTAQSDLGPPATKRRSSRRPKTKKENEEFKPMEEPKFLQYLEMSRDAIIDEHPELSQDEIVAYLYKTWQFQLRKSNSPTNTEEHSRMEDISKTVPADDEKNCDSNLIDIQDNKAKADVKVTQSKLENCWKLNKRNLRLRKSHSPSGLITKSDVVEIATETNLTDIKDGNSKVDAEFVVMQSKLEMVTSSDRNIPSGFAEAAVDEKKILSNTTVAKENKSKSDVEVAVVLSNLETKISNKRSLRLRKSQSPLDLITAVFDGEITPESKEGKPKVIVSQANLETKKSNKRSVRLHRSQSMSMSTGGSESFVTKAVDDEVVLKSNLTAIKENQLKADAHAVSQSNCKLSSKKRNARLRKSQSSSSLSINIIDNELKEDKSKAEVDVVLPQLNLETKRSLRLRKSQSLSVSKKTEDMQRDSKFETINMMDSKVRSHSKITQEVNEKETINNIDFKMSEKVQLSISKTDLENETPVMNKDTSDNDVYVINNSDKPGLCFRISKVMLEPKVVLERKKEIFVKDKTIDSLLVSDDKAVIKEIKTEPEVESENAQASLEMKSIRMLDEPKSCSEFKESFQDNQENDVEFGDKNDSKTTPPNTQPNIETVLENKIPEINGVLSETEEVFEVSHSKRRSLRLQRSQSSSKSTEQKQEHNDQSTGNKETDTILETKSNESATCLEDEIRSKVLSQNESSNVVNVPVEDKPTNKQSEKKSTDKVDIISLASDLTNDFIDRSSDKDFDPDAISLSSITSEISNISEVLPRLTKPTSILEKNDVFQKMLESDNESISSLDDVTLSELKTRSTKEETAPNLKRISMDSVKSDTSERKLRLVLSDCILDAKDSNLPNIKKVRSEANEEFEIFESNTEINTCKKPEMPKDKPPLESKVNGFGHSKSASPDRSGIVKVEMLIPEPDTLSIKSSGSETSVKRKGKNKQDHKPMEEPEFLQYLEMKQDALLDEHPEVTPSEVAAYLYKTWQYEESLKSDIRRNEDAELSNLVKGANQVIQEPPKKKKAPKQRIIDIKKIMKKSSKNDLLSINETEPRELPKRKASKAFYKEDFSDIEDEIQMFEIFNSKKDQTVPKNGEPTPSAAPETVKIKLETENKDMTKVVTEGDVNKEVTTTEPVEQSVIVLDDAQQELEEYYDQEELYFEQLTNPKPNVFKGLIREKVCEICENTSNLVKCKGCSGMFHVECVKKEDVIIDMPAPTRGRKKKKKTRGRKPKSSLDSNEESHSDEKSQDLNMSEEIVSVDDAKDLVPIVIPDADNFESQLEAKMKEIIETVDKIDYDSYSSDDGIDWANAVAGKCEIIDVKPKTRPQSVNADNFKCKNCQKDDTPICFVCKSPVSPRDNVERRQKCQVAHCHKYYHLECLEHWPQTQFNAGEPSKSNKKIDEHFEALACPRHVCHTCVCDDPRGCKTRFSGDKLARCVRCPATYHSFTKCLPAGSQILSASHIVCPRHYEHRPGKIPYHVNTGWCFICALGGNLICCDYCPTSFHADCLNIEPPEGGYMCEDCETGRLPLYGEMVWVKLGHYRWWPGIVLHPSEIPDNIMAVKHSPGEFVVRFFGQYDHYWVNRGRVFPFQEGDSGRISTQKSKIDEAFTIAMAHAKRAFEILKNVEPNDEENQDIQSSLLPPHYVKLKVNKPCGALYGKKVDIEESSLTQCECNPDEEDPCGPYSHCLNRMLLTECGPICRAGERCLNRAFEKRQYPKLVPYRTSHRGWGLKTLEPIKAGQFVIEYVGELIDEAEFRRRMQRKHEIRDENFYFLTLDKERLIDAGPKGNLARFMNHCCEPNCETQKWTVLGDVRVGLFALHDIPANTEVTFNYNLECTGIEKKQCMCGAKRCAGYIGAKPKQDDPQPKKLKLAAKRTYKKRKNTIESPSPSTKNKPKRPVGRPAKPRELTEIEKDLLIIKNATNGISSDSEGSGRLSSVDDRDKNTAQALKRKRVSFSTEETVVLNGCSSPSEKKIKLDDEIEKPMEVGD